MSDLLQEYLNNSVIITESFKDIQNQGIVLKNFYLCNGIKNKSYLYNHGFMEVFHKLNKSKYSITKFNKIFYTQNNYIFLSKNYKFGRIISANLKRYEYFNFLKKKSEFLSLFKELKIKYCSTIEPFEFKIIDNKFDICLRKIEKKYNEELINFEKNNIIILTYKTLKKDLPLSSQTNNVHNPNWSISSSSNEDDSMINKRLNEQLDANTLSTSSSSFEDDKIILKTFLNQKLNQFIQEDNLSFYKNNQKDDSLVVYNLSMPTIEDFKAYISYKFTNLPNKPYFIKNSSFSALDLNIPVYNGSNFFVEDDKEMSPNLLINYLQKIKKNHRSDDSLIFCFNILKLYNHINNKDLYIYLNLFNTDVPKVFQNMPNHVAILEQKIFKFPTNFLQESELKDLNKFSKYLYENKYKEANQMLNDYDLNSSEFNFMILKLISYLQHLNFYEKDPNAKGQLYYDLKKK